MSESTSTAIDSAPRKQIEVNVERGDARAAPVVIERQRRFHMAILYRALHSACFRTTRATLALLFKGLWVRAVVGRNNLPKEGPVIAVANHTSHVDWIILASLLGRRAFFLAADEVRQDLWVKWLKRFNPSIYFDRGKPGIKCFRELLRRLRSRNIAVIFPEGTRSRTGRRTPSRPGFVKLALKSGAPIIPIAIRGAHRILPPHSTLPRFRRCSVIIGCPIEVAPATWLSSGLAWELGKPQDDVLKEMAERVMDVIGDMAGPCWDNPNLRRRHSVSRGTTSMRRYGQNVAAFFDVDRTLVPFYTQYKFSVFCMQHGYLSLENFVKVSAFFMTNHLGLSDDNRDMRERFYAYFSTKTVRAWEDIVRDFVVRVIRPAISRGMHDLLSYHMRQRHRIVLVSASVEPIIIKIGEQIGTRDVIATKLEVVGGHYTGRVSGCVIVGFRKALAIDEFARANQIDLSSSYAYGDSISDAQLLKRVGIPAAINPQGKMVMFAQRKNWPVLRV